MNQAKIGTENGPRDSQQSHDQSEPVELVGVENGGFKFRSCTIFLSSAAD